MHMYTFIHIHCMSTYICIYIYSLNESIRKAVLEAKNKIEQYDTYVRNQLFSDTKNINNSLTDAQNKEYVTCMYVYVYRLILYVHMYNYAYTAAYIVCMDEGTHIVVVCKQLTTHTHICAYSCI